MSDPTMSDLWARFLEILRPIEDKADECDILMGAHQAKALLALVMEQRQAVAEECWVIALNSATGALACERIRVRFRVSPDSGGSQGVT